MSDVFQNFMMLIYLGVGGWLFMIAGRTYDKWDKQRKLERAVKSQRRQAGIPDDDSRPFRRALADASARKQALARHQQKIQQQQQREMAMKEGTTPRRSTLGIPNSNAATPNVSYDGNGNSNLYGSSYNNSNLNSSTSTTPTSIWQSDRPSYRKLNNALRSSGRTTPQSSQPQSKPNPNPIQSEPRPRPPPRVTKLSDLDVPDDVLHQRELEDQAREKSFRRWKKSQEEKHGGWENAPGGWGTPPPRGGDGHTDDGDDDILAAEPQRASGRRRIEASHLTDSNSKKRGRPSLHKAPSAPVAPPQGYGEDELETSFENPWGFGRVEDEVDHFVSEPGDAEIGRPSTSTPVRPSVHHTHSEPSSVPAPGTTGKRRRSGGSPLRGVSEVQREREREIRLSSKAKRVRDDDEGDVRDSGGRMGVDAGVRVSKPLPQRKRKGVDGSIMGDMNWAPFAGESELGTILEEGTCEDGEGRIGRSGKMKRRKVQSGRDGPLMSASRGAGTAEKRRRGEEDVEDGSRTASDGEGEKDAKKAKTSKEEILKARLQRKMAKKKRKADRQDAGFSGDESQPVRVQAGGRKRRKSDADEVARQEALRTSTTARGTKRERGRHVDSDSEGEEDRHRSRRHHQDDDSDITMADGIEVINDDDDDQMDISQASPKMNLTRSSKKRKGKQSLTPQKKRKAGEEWTNAEGITFKLGEDGVERRLAEIKEMRKKYRLPADSQFPGRDEMQQVLVERWLTKKEYEDAKNKYLLAWQTSPEEQEAQQKQREEEEQRVAEAKRLIEEAASISQASPRRSSSSFYAPGAPVPLSADAGGRRKGRHSSNTLLEQLLANSSPKSGNSPPSPGPLPRPTAKQYSRVRLSGSSNSPLRRQSTKRVRIVEDASPEPESTPSTATAAPTIQESTAETSPKQPEQAGSSPAPEQQAETSSKPKLKLSDYTFSGSASNLGTSSSASSAESPATTSIPQFSSGFSAETSAPPAPTAPASKGFSFAAPTSPAAPTTSTKDTAGLSTQSAPSTSTTSLTAPPKPSPFSVSPSFFPKDSEPKKDVEGAQKPPVFTGFGTQQKTSTAASPISIFSQQSTAQPNPSGGPTSAPTTTPASGNPFSSASAPGFKFSSKPTSDTPGNASGSGGSDLLSRLSAPIKQDPPAKSGETNSAFKPNFNFAAPPATSQAPSALGEAASKPPFGFGMSSTSAPPSSGTQPVSPFTSSSPAFPFGAKSGASNSAAPSAPSAPSFAFSSSTKPPDSAPNPSNPVPSIFGNSTGGSAFGNPSENAKAKETTTSPGAPKPPFAFGTTPSGTITNSSTANPIWSGFGSKPDGAKANSSTVSPSNSTSTTSVFGNTSSTSSPFGSTTASSTTQSLFGSSTKPQEADAPKPPGSIFGNSTGPKPTFSGFGTPVSATSSSSGTAVSGFGTAPSTTVTSSGGNTSGAGATPQFNFGTGGASGGNTFNGFGNTAPSNASGNGSGNVFGSGGAFGNNSMASPFGSGSGTSAPFAFGSSAQNNSSAS